VFFFGQGWTSPFGELTRLVGEVDDAFALCSQAYQGFEEKRGSPRFPWSAEIGVTLLPTQEAIVRPARILRGVAENIAKGGIGMFCDRPIPAGMVVRCEIALLNQVAYIPTLMKVQWTDSLDEKKRYRIGLQFLL